MNRKIRTGLLVLPAAAVLGAAVWGGLWYRSRTVAPGELIARLPSADAVIVSVDFAALRREGILGLLENSKVAEEAEYREFAQRIDFDYKKDLDSVLLAVAPTGRYLLVRGRFNWKRLEAYVESQSGRCDHSFCRMQGSAPERRISFFPLRRDLMALAVSADESAALRLSAPVSGAAIDAPHAPVWVSIPPSVLQSSESLPSEAQAFARSLAGADGAVLSLLPEGARFAARLTVRCHTAADAAELAMQLNRLSALLRQTFSDQHQTPNPADLTGVLAAGTFHSDGARVSGEWPIERAFFQNLLAAPN